MGSCVSAHKKTASNQWRSAAQGENHVTDFQVTACKEDSFFDSNPWLESDCEDFFSVNGDFTPSRGNTPVHESSFIEARPSTSFDVNKVPEIIQPPSGTPMRLADFLHESFRETLPDDLGLNLQRSRSFHPSDQTPPTGFFKSRSVKLSRSVTCCVPSLPRSLSSNRRKKRFAEIS